MVRKMRGLLLLGLFGLALLIGELLWVHGMQHTPLPLTVTPEQAKATAAAWLGDGELTVEQLESAAVSRHLQERKMTDAFRQEADDANKPLVMWKVKSGAAEVLVNRQNGRVEGIRGMTLALFPGSQDEQVEQVRQALMKRFGVQTLSVSSINNTGAEHLLLSFETGYQYEGLREMFLAELAGDRWGAFEHRLEVVAASEAKDLETAEASVVKKIALFASGLLFLLVIIGIVVSAFYTVWKRGLGGRRLTGEALVSASMPALCWLIEPSLAGLLKGVAYAGILFSLFVITAPSGPTLLQRVKDPDWLHRQVTAGYGVFGILAGVSTLLSWLASAFGFWASDLQQQETLALSPWPLLLTGVAAVMAALSEELIFRRLFGRWLQPALVAALASSLLWSLTHLSYDVSPWYYRILELGLVIGPLFFWLYRRYGLGAVITGHFLYDSFLASVTMGGMYGDYRGLLWLLLPLLVFAYKKKGLRV
ncbi:membrane protease YdiL (CAAX protease family) [Tumebacillus sp. BK434]|uniref:CPBP family intramembrane glutamic endopeptidase n=1 Tax=Tumebacillus sp. BK434 TaxID=2512169 RepID=UPI0010DA6970|nr:type II CAAX endopeptidase family protein [Tumebacillus sp. BK434]TCP54534.1 membrane protease YdiL (CAAX protease family) [Tumebacillus sp. BK434]